MRVFDFDGTIYDGDSGIDFVTYSLKKYPFLVIKSIFLGFIKLISFKSLKEIKESLFSFTKKIKDLDKHTKDFAIKHKDKVMDWYQEVRQDDDIIISASLDIYLIPLLKEIGIKEVICTKYDLDNAKIIGDNNKGLMKINMLKEKYGDKPFTAYGNSKGDKDLLNNAKEAFLIIDKKPVMYDHRYR